MKKLSNKELEIMELFWKNGPMTAHEIREQMPDPKPHFNTVSTQIRLLEKNGFLDHRREGMGYRYFYKVEWQEYNEALNGNPLTRCLENSYIKTVSAFVKEEKISVAELRELLDLIDPNK
ncbi:MAG: BlaI/MecI/CopY family transcriptional regulator [Bacteroidaceae bacterium]|nr:BlaI/MecI/CopY family transcriptional regulator [Bacteroidaceae bacterium]